MRHSCLRTSFMFVLAVMSGSFQGPQVLADDISGVDRLLCAALQATRCTLNAQCERGSLRNWNIPDFFEIDLIEKRLQTTPLSGEKRMTLISTLRRKDGHTFLQGIDGNRIFSIVINDQSGYLTAALPSDGAAISVFAVCTSLPEAQER